MNQSELLPKSVNDIYSVDIKEIEKLLLDNRSDILKFKSTIENEIENDSSCEVARKINLEYLKIFESIIDNKLKNIKYLDVRDLNLFLEAESFFIGELNEPLCLCAHCTSYRGYLELVISVLRGEFDLEEAVMYSLNMRERVQLKLLEEESEKILGFLHGTPPRYKNSDLIKVYLDQNTISRCSSNKEFYNLIMGSKNKYKYFYSPSHLEEIYKWKHEDKNKFIESMSVFTDDVIVIPWKEYDKKPCLELFYEVPYMGLTRSSINAPMTAQILEEIKCIRDYRNKITYNKYLKKSHRNSINDPSTTKNIFEKHRELIEQLLSELNCSLKLDEMTGISNIYEDHFLVNDVVYKLSNCLDILNFKKDTMKDKIRSSVHDIEHLIYATRGNIFVTSDKKLFERAKQIYGFVCPEIQVYYIDSYIEKLKNDDY